MASTRSVFLLPVPIRKEPPKATQKQHPYLSLLQLSLHLKEALQIHSLLIKSSLDSDPYFAGRLSEFYSLSENGKNLPFAEKVLNSFPYPPPLFILNTLMRAHLNNQNPLRTIHFFQQILDHCIEKPDRFTFTFALKASTQILHCALPVGLQVHCQAIKHGFETNLHVRNKLIHLYAVYGRIVDARKVFDGSTELDVVAWNSMLQAYADCKDGEALWELFCNMPNRDVVSWNTMIGFYIQTGEFDEAIAIFRSMQESKECRPNRVTMINVLSAVCHLGGLSQGKWAHAYINRKGVELDENLSSALINMYSKCGCIECAIDTFELTDHKSVDTWNAMIAGFTTNGLSPNAIDLLFKMESSGVVPNLITFACVLNACSHGGLVEEGMQLFKSMSEVYEIEPDIGHYGCMVDLFGRAGVFDKAEAMIEEMPMKPDALMWKSLAGACRIHRNFELGRKAGYNLIELAPKDHASYVLLSNIHASANDWSGVYQVRKMMANRGVRKVPGCSSIELDGIVHEFIAGDSKNSKKKEIYDMLEEMGERLRLEGYEPDTKQVLLDIEDEDVKESSLSHHSEKLAIAFGLITTNPGTTIRVVKNLRVCGDCHAAIKILSKVYDRDIIVRDSNRFHQFGKEDSSMKPEMVHVHYQMLFNISSSYAASIVMVSQA